VRLSMLEKPEHQWVHLTRWGFLVKNRATTRDF
jgi:hypothetical protein